MAQVEETVSSVSTTSEQNERLLSFSDALFAIALTFLALDLGSIPQNIGATGGPTVGEFLTENLRDYGVYFVTFLVVAVFWLRHHLIFRYVKRTSGIIVWLNIGILAMVAALPYPAGLFAEAPEVPLALVAQLVPLFGISLLLWAQWEVARRQGLTMPGLPRATFVNIRAQLIVSPVVLGVGLVIAYYAYQTDNPDLMYVPEALWSLLLIAPWVVAKIWRSKPGAYELPESQMSPEWQSYSQANAEAEEQSRSILARIRGGSDADRLKVLTDGVVAIAVTILALQLKPPSGEDASTTEAVAASLASSQIWTYWITFVYITFFWLAHVRIFSRIHGANFVVLWLNMIFLMLVAFLPMPSELMAEAHSAPATALYLAVMCVTSLSLSGLGAYATYRLGFSGGYVSKRARDLRTLRSASLTFGFALAFVCVLVFDNPELANIVWIVFILTVIYIRRVGGDDPATSI